MKRQANVKTDYCGGQAADALKLYCRSKLEVAPKDFFVAVANTFRLTLTKALKEH